VFQEDAPQPRPKHRRSASLNSPRARGHEHNQFVECGAIDPRVAMTVLKA
jgi:hypothetical protein